MRKVFWENPYQTRLKVRVVKINQNWVLFNETIAYSFAGGQESDKTYINDMLILDSQLKENVIYYRLPDNHNLSKNDEVVMTIDWPRRHRLMRLHFAAELVLEIVTQQFNLRKVGAHIAETKARIDFHYDENISSLFNYILEQYNEIIRRNLPIYTDFSDIKKQRRFWKIEGFAQVSCGGTHVKSTAEVGFVTLKRKRRGKSLERIEIQLINTDLSKSSLCS